MKKKSRGENSSASESGPDQQKRRIVSIAARLFAKKGYDGTTMDDIAAEMGATKGTIYHYFRSKHALLYQSFLLVQAPMITSLREIVATADPPDEKLRRAISTQVAILLAHQTLSGLLFNIRQLAGEYDLPPANRRVIKQNRREYRELFERILREGIEAGLFRPVDVPVIARTIINGYAWLVYWFKPRGRLSASEAADVLADFLMDGLLTRPSVPRGDDVHMMGVR